MVAVDLFVLYPVVGGIRKRIIRTSRRAVEIKKVNELNGTNLRKRITDDLELKLATNLGKCDYTKAERDNNEQMVHALLVYIMAHLSTL